MEEETLFETRDLGFAAYLIVKGIELKGTRYHGGTVWFDFERTQECYGLKKEFHEEDGQVPAKKYHSTCHDLKGEVWKLKNGSNKG